MTGEEVITRSSDVSMTREEAAQQLSFWKELWESKKAECVKYENLEYAWEKKYMLNCNIEVCKIALEALKQAEAVQKKGKWIDTRDFCGEFLCSNCHETNINNFYTYCPHCGARMEER